MTFFGTQPTLTQVPPSRCDSMTAALAPYSAARCAQARPPLPPPMTMRSKASVVTVNSIAKDSKAAMIYGEKSCDDDVCIATARAYGGACIAFVEPVGKRHGRCVEADPPL